MGVALGWCLLSGPRVVSWRTGLPQGLGYVNMSRIAQSALHHVRGHRCLRRGTLRRAGVGAVVGACCGRGVGDYGRICGQLV